MEMKHKKGTTTVGIVTSNGIVLAADKRASLGHLAMHKTKKINKISKFIGLTQAGSVADSQLLVKYLKAEMKLYELDTGSEPTIEVGSNLLSTILYGGKGFFPYMVGMIMGGKSGDGSLKLFSIFGDGSSISDTYTTVGSGMELALGVLQANYKEGLSAEEGINLAVSAVNTAIKRDVFSGEGIDVAVIDENGFRMLEEKAVATALNKK